ncbi:hypothetical protein [Wenyingzhuangia sp. 2_MG-2023]|uniref:hypothetical protein n=1 Tax=Wenyingzhuangia sp. 2_MG-2023 TaxID=3062639 RepID=UPI0026E2D6F9|nr:hypothetical protein [Wenyingzhuangia sp. 2_MG-2023]MDO6737317.1 hypothetical protein [Wenyingzhuangia sp. 2_MG-2023]
MRNILVLLILGISLSVNAQTDYSKLSEREIVSCACRAYGGASIQGKDPLEELTKFVLKLKGYPEDYKPWEKIVIDFLNEYGEILICSKADTTALFDNEQFYKRAVSQINFEIFYDLLTDDEYPVELNMVQIRNGKPETLLDFIKLRIDKGVTPEFEKKLNSLISDLRELGAKYAYELKN